MTEIDLTEVLRPGLLSGVSIVLAHGGPAGPAGEAPVPGALAAAVGSACTALGGTVQECALICSGDPEGDDAAVDRALTALPAGAGALQMLVLDAAGLFARLAAAAGARGGEPGASGDDWPGARADALIATLEASWRVTRVVANAAFIPGSAGGRIVYVAPPTQASGGVAHADAARAGLENLARTLSIEWARYGITSVAIAPGPRTTPQELAGVVAYLASPAGDYFSGCQLDLRGASPGA